MIVNLEFVSSRVSGFRRPAVARHRPHSTRTDRSRLRRTLYTRHTVDPHRPSEATFPHPFFAQVFAPPRSTRLPGASHVLHLVPHLSCCLERSVDAIMGVPPPPTPLPNVKPKRSPQAHHLRMPLILTNPDEALWFSTCACRSSFSGCACWSCRQSAATSPCPFRWSSRATRRTWRSPSSTASTTPSA